MGVNLLPSLQLMVGPHLTVISLFCVWGATPSGPPTKHTSFLVSPPPNLGEATAGGRGQIVPLKPCI
jgi:hypothetical protein